jgi:hypothetical protein
MELMVEPNDPGTMKACTPINTKENIIIKTITKNIIYPVISSIVILCLCIAN